MPRPVIDRLVRYQSSEHANIHRAVHYLSEKATSEYEAARRKVQAFVNAREDREVIFTSGTTDAINLVAHGYGRKFIGAGDEIILTTLEHHSNIVPWQMLAEEKGAKIRVAPINDRGELIFEEFQKLFTSRTKFVGLSHVSNALGTINPVKALIAFAHEHGVPVLVDGISPWTCRTSTAISMLSLATSCAGPPASASSTARRRCSRGCNRSRAAAT
jgi:cysteine desulfurase/selenocysteine lyase